MLFCPTVCISAEKKVFMGLNLAIENILRTKAKAPHVISFLCVILYTCRHADLPSYLQLEVNTLALCFTKWVLPSGLHGWGERALVHICRRERYPSSHCPRWKLTLGINSWQITYRLFALDWNVHFFFFFLRFLFHQRDPSLSLLFSAPLNSVRPWRRSGELDNI